MENLYSFVLIDDEAISNQLSEIQIKRVFKNAEVKSYSGAKDALQAIETNYTQFAKGTIIFLDINMPVSGWVFLDAFAKLPDAVTTHFNIYLLSALAEERDIEKAGLYPAVLGFLEKPLTKIALLNIVGGQRAAAA